MTLESEKKIKLLDEYIEFLKQDLLFLMAEHKLKPENIIPHNVITIKRELDKAVQEKMRLSQIYYSTINNNISHAAAGA